MKKVAKLFVTGIILLLFMQIGWNLYNNRSIFDVSSWTEKCIFCYFENRHNCNICRLRHRQCPFCDKHPSESRNRNQLLVK